MNSQHLSGKLQVKDFDLSKKRLTAQIHQLQKEYQKLSKSQKQKNIHINTKPSINSRLSPRDQSSVVGCLYKRQKQVKPAISQTWKNMFKLQPQLFESQQDNHINHQQYWIEPELSSLKCKVSQFYHQQITKK